MSDVGRTPSSAAGPLAGPFLLCGAEAPRGLKPAPQRTSPSRLAAFLLLAACGLHAATPAEFHRKVGVYVWGALASDLAAASADVKRLGADQAVRVYIGPGAWWDPSDPSDNSPLDVKVRRADYREFLAGFPVVMLTAYDVASFGRYKTGRVDAEHLAATADEFRRFTLELAKTPGRKIIANWEFENDCVAGNWPGCIEYYQARIDGIAKGRGEAKALGYPGEIVTAFEFTIVPGFPGRPSGLVEASPKLKGVDVWSYSSWHSVGWKYDPKTMRQSFEWALVLIREFAEKAGLTKRVIIGELGEYWDQHPSGERLKAAADACLDNGVEYVFNWVLYDQPGHKDEWGRDASHFGKYGQDRAITPQGEAFRRWFRPAEQRAPADGRKSKCMTAQCGQ
jgi:hypothetical protein